MQLKEAIQICLTYLGDEDASINTQTAQHPKLKLLVKCANLVIKEIATEYVPLIEEEIVEVNGGKISYDALLHKVAEVRKVQDVDRGLTSNFYCVPTHCKVLNDGVKKARIVYSYIPLDIDIEDDCPLPPVVSAKTLALGICAEYSMISGMYEQSVMYSDRFKQDMRTAVRKKGEIRVKPRRWC
ncbi:MAG: hypothetical protein K2I23_03290 [Clostridia bacterium]|nr:hypothetical protein [Clostridia bacterium]